MWHGVSVKAKPTGELITLPKLKARLRIDAVDDDDLLADLLKGAIARVDGPAGIGFAMLEQTWRKSIDCFPFSIVLPGAPVKSVASVSYVDPNGMTQTLDPAAYRVEVDSEPVRIEPAYGMVWPATRHVIGAVKVEYVLGESAADDVPPDLIDAVCMLVAHRYENREAALIGVAGQELPLGVQQILSEYQRGHVTA